MSTSTLRPGLTAATAEPEHYHVGGSAGGPGENSAECACGTVFAGFDTHAEATALLDRHIADPDGTNSEQAESDPRRAALQTVMAGVAAGLPVPMTIYMPDHCTHLNLKMVDNDQAAVDAWVAHFGLAEPKLGPVILGSKRGFQSYESAARSWPVSGWTYEVESFIDVPEPEDPEKAAMQARIAELEAQLAGGAR